MELILYVLMYRSYFCGWLGTKMEDPQRKMD